VRASHGPLRRAEVHFGTKRTALRKRDFKIKRYLDKETMNYVRCYQLTKPIFMCQTKPVPGALTDLTIGAIYKVYLPHTGP